MHTELEPSHRRWHPWRILRDHYPEVQVVTTHRLPNGVHGLLAGTTIWICCSLNQVQRRCALTHELIHYVRGVFPIDLSEEAVVEKYTALQLIPFADLLHALRWNRHPDPEELADDLWVTVDVLATRINNLNPIEVAELEYQLDGDWLYPERRTHGHR